MIGKRVAYTRFYVESGAGTLVGSRLLANDFFKGLGKSRFGLVAHFFGSLRDTASLTQQSLKIVETERSGVAIFSPRKR